MNALHCLLGRIITPVRDHEPIFEILRALYLESRMRDLKVLIIVFEEAFDIVLSPALHIIDGFLTYAQTQDESIFIKIFDDIIVYYFLHLNSKDQALVSLWRDDRLDTRLGVVDRIIEARQDRWYSHLSLLLRTDVVLRLEMGIGAREYLSNDVTVSAKTKSQLLLTASRGFGIHNDLPSRQGLYKVKKVCVDVDYWPLDVSGIQRPWR